MKSIKILCSLLFLGLLMSCSKDDGGNSKEEDELEQVAGAVSQICAEVNGMEAIYWDLFNGISRGDIPGGIPTLDFPGNQFIHSGYPALGFTMPAGYFAVELSDQQTQTIGVNVLRNDEKALWRYLNTTFSGNVDANAVLEAEKEILVSILGTPGSVQTVCSRSASQPQPGNAVITSATAMIRSGTTTAFFGVNSYTSFDLGVSFVSIQITAAPTTEFPATVLNDFLPMNWQLLYTGGNTLIDSDGDGEPDVTDADPNDPDVQ